jgi:pSer/pThr/pTyr-binding forkhead associated (FHA) protein
VDELTYVEILGRHGEVAARHAVTRFPVRIGRAYDNDVILEDPFVAPHHAVVERSPEGVLELADAGSRNGLFRVGAKQPLAREQIHGDARYRIGHTEIRIRPSSHPVAPELVERRDGRWSGPVVASAAVLGAGACAYFVFWSDVFERSEPAKLLVPALIMVALVLFWAGAWGLAGRLLLGERRLARHLTVASLMFTGILTTPALSSYPAFALSARGFFHVFFPALAAVVAWGIWRHLSLVTRNPGWGVALTGVAIATVSVGSLALYNYVEAADDLTRMRYLDVIKPPVVRLADGRAPEEFFREAERLRGELEPLKGK